MKRLWLGLALLAALGGGFGYHYYRTVWLDPKQMEIRGLKSALQELPPPDGPVNPGVLEARCLTARIDYLEGREDAATCCNQQLRILGSSLELASMTRDNHYPGALSDLCPDVLRAVPACPLGGAYALESTGPKATADNYTILCQGHHTGYTAAGGLISTLAGQQPAPKAPAPDHSPTATRATLSPGAPAAATSPAQQEGESPRPKPGALESSPAH